MCFHSLDISHIYRSCWKLISISMFPRSILFSLDEHCLADRSSESTFQSHSAALSPVFSSFPSSPSRSFLSIIGHRDTRRERMNYSAHDYLLRFAIRQLDGSRPWDLLRKVIRISNEVKSSTGVIRAARDKQSSGILYSAQTAEKETFFLRQNPRTADART